MMNDDIYIRRCLELALLGEGYTAPNPMVGCVIVHNGRIIGEGWHKRYGAPHAEVEAVASVSPADRPLLAESTLYVNLEPCCHHGKTPPCSELIIRERIPRVVVGIADPNPLVAGKGIEALRGAGIEVRQSELEEECRRLNAKFITAIACKRPYITIKFAQTIDGYLDNNRLPGTPPTWMTGRICKQLVYRMRSSNMAIMAGTNTIAMDNPSLTSGETGLPNPVRIIADRTLRLSPSYAVFDGKARTILFTTPENIEKARILYPNCEIEGISFDPHSLRNLIDRLYEKGIQSLFVEGGAALLNTLIGEGLWDEMNVFTSPLQLSDIAGGRDIEPRGVKAPEIEGRVVSDSVIDGVRLTKTYRI